MTTILELQRQLQETKARMEHYFSKSNAASYNDYERKDYHRIALQHERKYYSMQEKIEELQKLGLSSTTQLASLKREIASFKRIGGDRTIGLSDRVVVGYSKALQNYVKVRYTVYSSFMRNVRGMGSLVGTKDIHQIIILPKVVYERILIGVERAGGAKQRTSFLGATQETRGGQILKRNGDSIVNFGGVFEK